MAQSKNNVVTHGMSGMLGKQLVFRQRGGKTIVATPPQTTKKATEQQLQQRKRFQRAVLYGQSALADPETKVLYDSVKGKVAFNVAVADFLHAPDIESIDLTGYTGQPNDKIAVTVIDDFMVKQVAVSIINEDGSLVEEGNAEPDAKGYVWIYTATRVNDSLDGDRIEIIASDMPGNISREEQLL